jgi:hypothetical protein
MIRKPLTKTALVIALALAGIAWPPAPAPARYTCLGSRATLPPPHPSPAAVRVKARQLVTASPTPAHRPAHTMPPRQSPTRSHSLTIHSSASSPQRRPARDFRS